MPQLAQHMLATMLVALGGWFTFAGAIAAAVPEALALSDVLAGYRIGPIAARHTRLLALLLALLGILLFVTGALVAVRSFP
ncbi:hypothetical protein [Sphingomonas sp.]|jgi:uncharacterized membrane protein|uniref:hypothetical protein n=1 Tax=Sphingomonas sp. TaxID=28214 RepID=UPI00262234FF|nr:hypothetical protein [Sphingomonas sp.]MDF2496075.1 hypothetical protein [Sphingomonas sp.]